uniref:Uncharacterized protein n=1 Tax=Eutreptiella gymnastica TaxID=73025 RepID=A0A7S1NLP1_9EUGL
MALTTPDFFPDRGLWYNPIRKNPVQGNSDVPTDSFPADTLKALKKKPDHDLFKWDNIHEWRSEIKLLMPAAFREWDPLVNPGNMYQLHDTSPYLTGAAFGFLNFHAHNYVGCNAWWKAPWRLPAWVAVWTGISLVSMSYARKSEYDYRKTRLMANNYYSRMRQVIMEREKRKQGPDHHFADLQWFNAGTNPKVNNFM